MAEVEDKHGRNCWAAMANRHVDTEYGEGRAGHTEGAALTRPACDTDASGEAAGQPRTSAQCSGTT